MCRYRLEEITRKDGKWYRNEPSPVTTWFSWLQMFPGKTVLFSPGKKNKSIVSIRSASCDKNHFKSHLTKTDSLKIVHDYFLDVKIAFRKRRRIRLDESRPWLRKAHILAFKSSLLWWDYLDKVKLNACWAEATIQVWMVCRTSNNHKNTISIIRTPLQKYLIPDLQVILNNVLN